MSTPNTQRLEFSAPDFRFAFENSQSFPAGADPAVIAQAQIKQLRETEGFLAGIENSLETLSKTRPLTEGEEVGLRQARTWRQQASSERGRIEYREQLIACDRPSQHIANAIRWNAICTDPDWCEAGGTPVAFDSVAVIENPVLASPNVKAQNVPVYRIGDLHFGVQGVAGRSLGTGSAAGSGFVKVLTGSASVYVNNQPVARNASAALINCGPDGLGGVRGALLTEEKPPKPPTAPPQASEALPPPGQRSSPRLEELKRAEAALQEGMVDVNAVDKVIRFEDINAFVDQSVTGSASDWSMLGPIPMRADYLAQVRRGILKAGVAVGEGAVGLVKLGVSAAQRQTPAGMALTAVQAQIAAENIRLGNTTLGTVGSTVGDVALSIVVPPEAQKAWARGDVIEAGTNTGINIATLGGFGKWLGKLTGTGKVADDVVTAGAASKADTPPPPKSEPTPPTDPPSAKAEASPSDGVHVSPPPPVLRRADDVIGTADEGPGQWERSPSRTKGQAYQEQITGVERGAEYKVDGVLFDGYDAKRGVLLDAKDWRGYPPANRSFWHEGTLDEATRQIRAARGKLIEWHFSTPQAKAAVDALLRNNRLGGITTIYTPGRR